MSRRSPARSRYASHSVGGAPHLAGEYISQRFGVPMTHVPYKNSPQAIQDVAAGHVQLTFADAGTSLPLIRERQAARAGGDLDHPARHAARRAAVRGGLRHPGFRSGVLAHAVRAGEHAGDDRRPAAHGDEAHHGDPGDAARKVASLGLHPPCRRRRSRKSQRYIKSEIDKWGGVIRKLGLAGSI